MLVFWQDHHADSILSLQLFPVDAWLMVASTFDPAAYHFRCRFPSPSPSPHRPRAASMDPAASAAVMQQRRRSTQKLSKTHHLLGVGDGA